jgi:methionyl-tRNA formyltransferase
MTEAAPWRVAIITVLPAIVQGYAEIVRSLGHEPVAVITPRRRIAGAAPMPFAAAHVADDPEALDILFPATKHSLARMLRAYDVDLGLCTGFPWLIPADALAAPRLGIVNGHPSLLPRYRGPFPIAWAVRNAETEIGLTYHLMDAEFDTGNILAQARVPLADDETEETLFTKFAPTAAELLPIAFDRLARGDLGDRQEGGEYQSIFEDGYWTIDPSHTVAEVHRQVRAWSFMPPIGEFGPFVERDGRRVKVIRSSLLEVEGAWRLECADGPLWIVESEPV